MLPGACPVPRAPCPCSAGCRGHARQRESTWISATVSSSIYLIMWGYFWKLSQILCEQMGYVCMNERMQKYNENAGKSSVSSDISVLPLSDLSQRLKSHHQNHFLEMSPFLQNIRIKMNTFFSHQCVGNLGLYLQVLWKLKTVNKLKELHYLEWLVP